LVANALTVLATAAAYYVAAKLGLSLAFVAAQVTAVWPPTGLALAAVLLLGVRVAPGILLGAFLANVTVHEPVATAAGIAVGNTLEALVGAWVLQAAGFSPTLDRLRDVLALVLAALASPLVSATIGVSSLCAGGVQPWTVFTPLWGVWWFGDALGDLVMAPLLLVWVRGPRARLDGWGLGEAAAIAATTIGAGLVVFVGPLRMPAEAYPLHYAVFPLVVWAALRFGQQGTATVIFATSALAIWGTAHGAGPFIMGTTHASLVMLQLFMAVVAVTALLLGAAIAERDLAERRAAADFVRLEVSEERLRLALDAGRMGVWDWSIETGDVKWSDNLEAIHGLPPGSFSGTIDGFREIVHPDDRARVERALQEALERGTGYDVEFRTVSSNRSHWMAGKGRVFRAADGRAVRMLGVGLDVTDRRRMEEELREQAHRLADADRRKDEFLAMLGHELRNPLTPLITALHLLRRDVADRERFLDMAERQVQQLVRLVDDLLDVARITQGKITLKKKPVALADVVTRAVDTARPLIESRGHALTVSLPAATVQLEADEARLAQVLGNLLGNAAKFTPSGGSIWLTAERVGDELVLRVRDTGAGLPAALLPHVFDLFVQGDGSPDAARGGLGIGLTVVRRLVELHGGRVEARSTGPGQGSEFVIRLPALPVTLVETVPRIVPTVRRSSSGLRILVVEDNVDAAESLATTIGLWGHDVRVAFDGPAALELAEGWAPGLILSDLGLPGMSGYELARRLRAQPAFGGGVLVALSGFGREEDKRQAVEAGFDHHFVKPCPLDVLEDLLERVAVSVASRDPRALH
jgi:two-component system CheB/CheR fusion protein